MQYFASSASHPCTSKSYATQCLFESRKTFRASLLLQTLRIKKKLKACWSSTRLVDAMFASTANEVQRLQGALAETGAGLKAALQRKRRQEQSEQRGGYPANKWMPCGGLCLFEWSARTTARFAGRCLGSDKLDLGKLARLLRDFPDAMPMDLEVTERWRSARRSADAFLAEENLVHWVAEQNFSLNVCPRGISAHLQLQKTYPKRLSTKTRAVNKWIQAWQQRWGVRRASLPFVAYMPDKEVVKDKVSKLDKRIDRDHSNK